MGKGHLLGICVLVAACGNESSKPNGGESPATAGVGGGTAPGVPNAGAGGGDARDDPPFAQGGTESDPDELPANAGRGSSNGGASSGGSAGTSPTTGGGASGAAGDSGGAAGEGDDPPEWSDVVPVRTRVGPRTTPRQLFVSQVQLGAYWETPSGDVLATFRTSVTQPQPGIAIYDYNYRLQTIVGASIQPVPDLEVGTCRYRDPPFGSCYLGLDPYGPTRRSLVTTDGTILVVNEKKTSGSIMHPIVERLDPATGMLSTLVEMTDIEMQASNLAYTANLALRELADGTIALATAMQADPARTIVFNLAGERLAQRAGYAFGERWQRFALFMGQTSGSYNQRFDWWDPRTGASARAFGFPPVTPGTTTPAFRTFVTPPGDVIFPGFTYTDRLMRLDADGVVVEDRALNTFNFLGALPDAGYLTYEPDPTRGYVLRRFDRRGESTIIYDEPTLMREARWPAIGSGGFYPIMDHRSFTALVDDAGNAYVGFVLQSGGNSQTDTYLVAFGPDGQKLWGLNLERTYLGTCKPETVLSRNRLIVRCSAWYLRRFLILGE